MSGIGRTDGTAQDVAERLERTLGPDIMSAFLDEDATELTVNPDGRVRLDTHSRGKVETALTLDAHRLRMFLNAVASAQGTAIGEDNPQLSAELPDARFRGARLQGFLPPVTSGPAVAIRKRPTRVYPLEHYVERGELPPAWRDALVAAVAERCTVVVCGATGSGKSTFANALLLEVARSCPADRVVILEDTVELQCPVRDSLQLRTAPGVSLAALVKATLRASPTRIVIGEVRDAAALDFLDAAATGHPGGVCTVHASTALGALDRLDRLAQRANVPSQRELIAETVHVVVRLEGGNVGRRVAELVLVDGLTPDRRFRLARLSEGGDWTPTVVTAA